MKFFHRPKFVDGTHVCNVKTLFPAISFVMYGNELQFSHSDLEHELNHIEIRECICLCIDVVQELSEPLEQTKMLLSRSTDSDCQRLETAWKYVVWKRSNSA
jgi:hypothetical protein